MKKTIHSLLIASLLCLATAQAGEPGGFGFNAAISVNGVFSPTLVAVKIAKVNPNSAADKAGMKIGDEIIEIDGHQVPGAKASDIQQLMVKEVGQTVAMKLKRENGEVFSLKMVATPKAK